MADIQFVRNLGREDLEPLARQIASDRGIPDEAMPYFLGLIDHESAGWNPRAKNPTSSATGLGQHLDKTARSQGMNVTGDYDDDRYDPVISLQKAADHLIEKYQSTGDWKKAIKNYGEGTDSYLSKVLKTTKKYLTPSEAEAGSDVKFLRPLDSAESSSSVKMLRPLDGLDFVSPVSGNLTSIFQDSRSHGQHYSGDIKADKDNPVYAPVDMEIIAGKQGGTNLRENDWWLHARDINTGNIYKFAHIGDISHLNPGDIIPRGQQFTTIGSAIDDPHLHMKIEDINGKPIDWTALPGIKRGHQVEAGKVIGQQLSNSKLDVVKNPFDNNQSSQSVVSGVLRSPESQEIPLDATSATLSQFSAPAGEMVGKALDLPFVPLRKGLDTIHKYLIEPQRERTINEWANALQSGAADIAPPEALVPLPSKESFVSPIEFALAPAYLKLIGRGVSLLKQVGKDAFYKYAPDIFFKKGEAGLPVPLSSSEIREKLMAMDGSERAEMARKYPDWRDVLEDMSGIKKESPVASVEKNIPSESNVAQSSVSSGVDRHSNTSPPVAVNKAIVPPEVIPSVSLEKTVSNQITDIDKTPIVSADSVKSKYQELQSLIAKNKETQAGKGDQVALTTPEQTITEDGKQSKALNAIQSSAAEQGAIATSPVETTSLVPPTPTIPEAIKTPVVDSGGVKKEPWEMTRGEFLEDIYAKLKKKYPNAEEKDLRHTVDNYQDKWVKSLRDRAAEGRIPDNVLDDIVAKGGLGTLREYRGVLSKGADGYLPPDVRNEKVKIFAKPKEKWEKTWNEFKQDQADSVTRKLTRKEWINEKARHRGIIVKALSEDKLVPPEVLRDYPELEKVASAKQKIIISIPKKRKITYNLDKAIASNDRLTIVKAYGRYRVNKEDLKNFTPEEKRKIVLNSRKVAQSVDSLLAELKESVPGIFDEYDTGIDLLRAVANGDLSRKVDVDKLTKEYADNESAIEAEIRKTNASKDDISEAIRIAEEEDMAERLAIRSEKSSGDYNLDEGWGWDEVKSEKSSIPPGHKEFTEKYGTRHGRKLDEISNPKREISLKDKISLVKRTFGKNISDREAEIIAKDDESYKRLIKGAFSEYERQRELKKQSEQYKEKLILEGMGDKKKTLFSARTKSPTFYSKLQKVAEQKLPGRGTPEVMSKLLQSWSNKGEFKADELKWSGIIPWLQEQKGIITKKQVLEQLQDNQVKIKEVELGTKPYHKDYLDRYKSITDLRDYGGQISHHEWSRRIAELNEEYGYPKDYYPDTFMSGGHKEYKFLAYMQLPPGGKNYREFYLTVPVKNATKAVDAIRFFDGAWEIIDPISKKVIRRGYESRDDAVKEARQLGISTKQKVNVLDRDKAFEVPYLHKTGDKSADTNRWAHVFVDDRVIDGKRYLTIHEIQSDWLQALRRGQKAPDFPFSKNWMEVALKRMIRYAAENGYDGLAWATGDAVKDRYTLKKQVDSIDWSKNDDGTVNFGAVKNNKTLVAKDRISYRELEDNIGKDLSLKIKDSKAGAGSLKGDALEIGGEWANRQYDEMMPQYLGKYTKQWGGKVGSQENLHTLDFTPQMKDSVLYQGQPLYLARGKNEGKEIRANTAGGMLQSRGYPLHTKTAEEGRRFLDDIKRGLLEGFTEKESSPFREVEYSDTFHNSIEFKEARQLANKHGIDHVIPLKNSPFAGAIKDIPGYGPVMFIDEYAGDGTSHLQIANHEIFHHLVEKGDPNSLRLLKLVDKNSPAFQLFKNALAADYKADGLPLITDNNIIAEELAADYRSGVQRIDVDGNIISLQDAFKSSLLAQKLKDQTVSIPKEVSEIKPLSTGPPKFMAKGKRPAPSSPINSKKVWSGLENEWFGNKDIEIHKNSVEAGIVQKKIQEALGLEKLTQAAKDMDKAIHLSLDIAKNPDRLRQIYNELTPSQKRIVDLIPKIDNNLGLKRIRDYIANQYEQVGNKAMAADIIANTIDNYVNRVWKIEGKSGSDVLQKFKTNSRHSLKRVFETILDGWERGMELRVEGASNALQTLKDEISRVIEDKQLIQEGKKLKIFSSFQHPGWEPINHPNFKSYRYAGSIKVEPIIQALRDFNIQITKTTTEHGPGAAINTSGPIKAVKDIIVNSLTARGMTEGEANSYINRIENAARGSNSQSTGDKIIKEVEQKLIIQTEKEKVLGHKIEPILKRNMIVNREGTILIKDQLYAPENVAKDLNNVLESSKIRGFKIGYINKKGKERNVISVDAITKYNAIVKATILQTSFYHHLAFAADYWLATHGKTWSDWNIRKSYKAGLKMIKDMNPELTFLIRNGLTLGRNQDWEENLIHESSKLGKKIDDIGGIPKVIKDKIVNLQERQAHFLFNQFGAGIKAYASLIEYKQALKHHPDMDPIDRAQMVARIMNDRFGGLHLGRLHISPTKWHLGRLLFLAPDWTLSNVRMMAKAFKAGGKEETNMYRRLWGSVIAKGLLMLTAANLLLSLGDDKSNWERLKSAWRAGGLRWLQLDYSPIAHKLGGDPKKRFYINLMRQYQDPLKWIFMPLGDEGKFVEFLIHKFSVIGKTIMEAIHGVNWQGRSFTNIEELSGLDQRTRGGLKYQLTKNELSKGMGLKLRQIPSFLLSQLVGSTPVQTQEMLGLATGEKEGIDAILKSAGIMSTSVEPKSEAQKLLDKYSGSTTHIPQIEQANRLKAVKEAKKIWEKGNIVESKNILDKAVEDKIITHKQKLDIIHSFKTDKDIERFKKLNEFQAREVFLVADEQEKKKFLPYSEKKDWDAKRKDILSEYAEAVEIYGKDSKEADAAIKKKEKFNDDLDRSNVDWIKKIYSKDLNNSTKEERKKNRTQRRFENAFPQTVK